MAGALRCGVLRFGALSYGKAGTVCCVMVVRGEFRSGQVRQAWLVESW